VSRTNKQILDYYERLDELASEINSKQEEFDDIKAKMNELLLKKARKLAKKEPTE